MISVQACLIVHKTVVFSGCFHSTKYGFSAWRCISGEIQRGEQGGFCYVELVMLLTWNQEGACLDIFPSYHSAEITESRDYNEYEMLSPCSDRCEHQGVF